MLKRRGERRSAVRQEHETLQVVAFQVGSEFYGLDIADVQEIDRLQPITRVPQAHSFVEGVVHLRGALIPVIDLARRFGLGPLAADRQSRIIFARLRGQSVGFMVNAVTGVLPLPATAIGSAPPLTFEQSARFVAGMARVGERVISLLSVDRLLSTDEAAQLFPS